MRSEIERMRFVPYFGLFYISENILNGHIIYKLHRIFFYSQILNEITFILIKIEKEVNIKKLSLTSSK